MTDIAIDQTEHELTRPATRRTHAEHVGAPGVQAQWIRSAVPLSLGRPIKQTSTETVGYRLAISGLAHRQFALKFRRVARISQSKSFLGDNANVMVF